MMNNEKEKDAIDTSKLDEILPKYDPLKLNSINLAQNYVSAFNTGMNIYQCVNQLQGYIEWVVKAVNDVVKSWNVQVGESIDQSKAIVRETTTEQFNTEWTNKQPELIEQVNTLTTNQFNEDWGVLENRINTTLETQNTKINSIQTQQTNLANQQTNLSNEQTTLSNRMDTFTSLSAGSTTGDAELQDIRVGANGVTYNNAGDAVRGQYSQLKEDLSSFKNDISTYEYNFTELKEKILYSKKCIYKDGTLLDTNDNYYVKEYELNNILKLNISGSANWGKAFYTFLKDDSVIQVSDLAKNESDISILRDKIVDVPKNANKLYVAYISTSLIGKVEEAIKIYEIKPYKKFINMKWACLGDSLTEMNEKTSKHYYDYVSENTGINVINLGVGGSGYMRKHESNDAFYQRVDTIPLDCDVITIFGSGNDVGANPLGTIDDTGTDTICGCINTTIDNILNRFLNAKKLPYLGIVTPTPWKDYDDNFKAYCNKIVEICEKRSIPCLNLFTCSNLHPNNAEFRSIAYAKDNGGGVHPSEEGHKVIAPRFESFLESLII